MPGLRVQQLRMRESYGLVGGGYLMEAVINDYISRQLVQDANLLPFGNTTVDAICAYLLSQEAASQAGSRG
jgi:hypothetical protein